MSVTPLLVKPFRGLRYSAQRLDLAVVVARSSSADPRHVSRLLDDQPQMGDGRDGALRRASLSLAEWRRAGVLQRDDEPALYVVRRVAESGTALGLFCVISVEGAPEGAQDPVRASQHQARCEALGACVEPVVAAFDEPRARRALENAIDRDSDASWVLDGVGYELWCVDDESTTARLAALLSRSPVTIEENEDLWRGQAAWWRGKTHGTEEGAAAGAHALAFFHPSDEPWPSVPVGAAWCSLRGSLSASGAGAQP